MEEANKCQFGAVTEVPLTVQSLFNQFNFDTAKTMLYVKVTANAIDWHGPLPGAPFSWMLEQLDSVIPEAKEDTDPHLHIFNFIHSVLKVVMFMQVQLMALENRRMAGDAPWEEFIDADASSPTVLKERDIVFLE
eukprot:EG_transcript_26659